MALIVFALDMSEPVGSRLAPELIAEIQAVAPSVVVNGSISTAKLADKAVEESKIADGAVTSPKIAQNGVDTINIADTAVTAEKLAEDSVTGRAIGVGAVRVVDSDDEEIALTIKFVTTTQYATIVSPDPNVEYHIKAG